MPTFTLHPTLHADTFPVADLPLCKLLLMNDTHFPWLILVPARLTEKGEYLRDLSDVARTEQPQLWTEIVAVENALKSATGAYKMNVAALSNVVQQLHIHIVARQETDAAWPRPVWGHGPATPYQPSAAGHLIAAVKTHLAPIFRDSI